MGPIDINQLLEGRNDQPNEICLTLYFEENDDLTERIRELLEPEVGLWDHKESFQLPMASHDTSYVQEAYLATEPPERLQSIYLFFIRPDLTTKTLAVQLIVSVLHHPKEGWELAANWLHHAWLRLNGILKNDYLGYSIIYQASIVYDEDRVPIIEKGLLNSLWWIHRHERNSMLGTIAAQRVSEAGWLWLVRYPSSSEEGMIYLVLGRDKQSKHLASEAFATRSSLLCSVDAFTHRAVRQGLELLKIYDVYEQNTVKPLRDAVRQLLQRAGGSDELDRMAQRLKPYASFCWDVERLAFSLKQQVSGINRLYSVDPVPIIASHHLLQIKAYEEEAQAIVIKNKDTLEIARVALSMAEATESKRANSNQERFNLLIAFVGIFLATDQILDTEFAKELLTLAKFEMPTVSVSKPPLTTEQIKAIPYWAIFFSRILSALSLTGIIFGVGWLIRRNRQSL